MNSQPQPYVFAIDMRDVNLRNWHALIASALEKAGFDVGTMLWTASPHIYSKEEIMKFWSEAFVRAGIARMDTAEDKEKMRTWFKVWKKETA